MILILGDSWGCGEWAPIGGPGSGTDEIVEHNGLARFLSDDGFDVINLSQPGGSNLKIATLLDNFLMANQQLVKNISHIFIFQTDWNRDVSRQMELSIHLKHQLLLEYYKKLNQIGASIDKEIHLIGGLADVMVYPNFEQLFSKLVIACQSSINYVLKNDSNVVNPTVSVYDRFEEHLDLMKKKSSTKELEELVLDLTLAQQRSDIFKENSEYFMGCHGNINFHKKLHDYIKLNYIKEKES